MKNIQAVSQNQLCTGCGTCAGVCPFNSINMVRSTSGLILPVVDPEKCKSCGDCILVCPGYQLDMKRLKNSVDGFIENPLLGKLSKCYWGYSNDNKIRYNSASGGICTEILSYALEEGLIDGALVTRMSEKKPLETEPFIAKSKEELLSASKSKYCPVATNELLNYVLKENGKFAIVGLPCHIHGIRMAQSIFPSLKKKIVLCLGLMCSHTVSYTGTEYLLKKFSINKNSISKIEYRGQGWPGSMLLKTSDFSKNIPLVRSWNSYWCFFSSFFFSPLRCTMCPDQNAEFADISLGDAWLPELKSDHVGSSVLVTRTEFADKIILKMQKANKITINPLSVDKVIQSQRLNLDFKKRGIGTRLALLDLFGRYTPKINPKPDSSFTLLNLIKAIYPFIGVFSSSNKYLKFFVKQSPLPLLRLYFGIFKYLGKTWK